MTPCAFLDLARARAAELTYCGDEGDVAAILRERDPGLSDGGYLMLRRAYADRTRELVARPAVRDGIKAIVHAAELLAPDVILARGGAIVAAAGDPQGADRF